MINHDINRCSPIYMNVFHLLYHLLFLSLILKGSYDFDVYKKVIMMMMMMKQKFIIIKLHIIIKFEKFKSVKFEGKKTLVIKIKCFTKVETLIVFPLDRRAREIEKEGKWVELVG